MRNDVTNKVYILSGPAGVGKSTTSKKLVTKLNPSAFISGDYISHMHINGRKKPWESEEEVSLIWNNILCLTRNFLTYGNNVVIDYVTFPKEAQWLCTNIKDPNVEVRYVVLWTNKETLVKRDNSRIPEERMGERSIILMNEFIESKIEEQHFFDTSNVNIENVDYVIEQIITNNRFKLT
ncbi:AAA family ATPase [Bacillus salitolerans]|uniref:AAA family ATPase n=1 Tax=Bacillus salitolerans TaxID=1437434 RepID=A0ABW4LUZ0_9BACI